VPDLTPQITQAASDPASMTTDGQSVTTQDPAKLIQLDQYLNNRAAASKRRRGLRFSKLVPPGAVSDNGGACTGSSFDQPGGCG